MLAIIAVVAGPVTIAVYDAIHTALTEKEETTTEEVKPDAEQ